MAAAGGGMLAGVVGGAASGIMNILGGIIGSAMQADQSEKIQKRAQDFAIKMMLKGPSLQMKGYDRAGLNPLLVVGGSPITHPGTGPAPPTPMPDLRPGDFIGSAKTAALMKHLAEGAKHEAAVSWNKRRKTRAEGELTEELGLRAMWETHSAKEAWKQNVYQTRIMRDIATERRILGDYYRTKTGRMHKIFDQWLQSSGKLPVHFGYGAHSGRSVSDITHRQGRFNRSEP